MHILHLLHLSLHFLHLFTPLHIRDLLCSFINELNVFSKYICKKPPEKHQGVREVLLISLVKFPIIPSKDRDDLKYFLSFDPFQEGYRCDSYIFQQESRNMHSLGPILSICSGIFYSTLNHDYFLNINSIRIHLLNQKDDLNYSSPP